MKEQTEIKKIGSGDQALFSQWDSIPKLAGFVKKNPTQASNVTHDFHLIDGIGRNSNPDIRGLGITNEFFYFDPSNGKEVQPSWFAVSDVMPFLTLETTLPRKITETIGTGKKFNVVATEMSEALNNLGIEEKQEVIDTLCLLGYPMEIPQDLKSIYKTLTGSNWFGIVDESGKSASSFNFKNIEDAQRALMAKLYGFVMRALPESEKPQARQRFFDLMGEKGRVYPSIKDKPLPEVAKIAFQFVSSQIREITGVDLSLVNLKETTSEFELPSPSETKKNDPRFLFFDWYVKNQETYDNTHNKVASQLTKNGENPIQPMKKSETPFWIVIDGKKFKLFYNGYSIKFGDTEIKLSRPIESHRDISEAIFERFKNQKVSLAPTAIGLLLQIRASGDALLPERGSSYIPQANIVWKEIVQNSSIVDLNPLIQGDIMRVSPNAISALPDGKKVRLSWYASEGFTKDENGFISTDEIKARWKEVVAGKRSLLERVKQEKDFLKKVEKLFANKNIPFIAKAIEKLGLLEVKESSAKDAKRSLMDEIKALVGKNDRIFRLLNDFLEGKTDSFPEDEVISSRKEGINNLKKILGEVTITSQEKKKLQSILEYFAALRFRELEGGAEAFEYANARPSLLTLYLMFGEEVVKSLVEKAQTTIEITDKEPILKTGNVDAEGNRIMVVEDKVGWVDRNQDKAALVIESIAQQLREQQMDSAVVLTKSNKKDADCRMIVVEKDGSISNMCANGVRATAYYMTKNYGITSVNIETASGETVVGYQQEKDKFAAKLSQVKKLSAQTKDDFRNIVSDKVLKSQNPEDVIKVLIAQIDNSIRVLATTHILQEPHLILAGGENLNLEQLAELSDRFMRLKDTFGRRVFPNGININFIKTSGDKLKLLTYERGVNAITGSCGTGAICAASLVMEVTGLPKVILEGKSGSLGVSARDGHYVLSGKASSI